MRHVIIIAFFYPLMSCAAVHTALTSLNDPSLSLKNSPDRVCVTSVEIKNTKKTLEQFNFKAAGVLPTWISKQRGKYVLVSREVHGKNKGTWDSFGGSRDPFENHPVLTASREFAEESAYALMRERAAREYVDVDSGNTEIVIASEHKKYALYITKFSQKYILKLQKNFYSNVKIVKDAKLKEKDALALVSWDELSRVLGNLSTSEKKVIVNAYVIDDHGNKKKQKIMLRPVLAEMLTLYFKNKPYQSGKNKMIRFY